MIPLARRFLLRDRGRLLVTVFGVGGAVALTLFLLAVYEGVKDGATRYVRTTPVDFWVCQKNANNLLKSSSFLDASVTDSIREINGVTGAAPLNRIITKARVGNRRSSTLFLLAFDPSTQIGAPATIAEGSRIPKPGEIIVDRAFARKYSLRIGSSIALQDESFRVAGISEGTNALVSQFGFVGKDDGERLLGVKNVTSFILVRVAPGADRSAIARDIRRLVPDTTVYTHDEFVANNLEEMQMGILPVFATIAMFAAVVGALVVALMLYSSMLERREDYATLKAIGAPHLFLLRLVVTQSVAGSLLGFLVGLLLAALVTPALLHLVPALTIEYTRQNALAVLGGSLFVGIASAIVPIQLLRRIYPAEVFRA